MPSEKKIQFVFLYTEIAGYFLSCVQKLAELYNAEIHVFRYPVNKEAPFKFPAIKNVHYYERDSFDRKSLLKTVSSLNPDFIYCAGWTDKDYLHIIKSFSGKIPTVLGFDNKWENSLRQNIASIIAPFLLTRYFSHCFVPGEKQKKYALKLGLGENQILTGLYSADFELFHSYYKMRFQSKRSAFPRKFLYAARYVKHKGINDLWTAFSELQEEYPNDWELWCVGTGDVAPVNHPKIKHFGFIQPENFGDIIAQTGVYVLPSHFEPWGVTLHEFAAAGFPLICSNEIGAAEKFLEDNRNGFLFHSGNIRQLKNCLKKIIALPDDDLVKMAEISVDKAKSITPEKWANTLYRLVKNFKTVER
jgi:glycosyltransferase involved in cell wall biosynthesis